jgi:8-oxo-dGTP pyrophosphatase MutT (NUDIX family)
MRLNFDPEQLPVLSVDDHLPAVPAQRLGAAALQQRFASPPQWQPEIVSDGAIAISDRSRATAHASVLVPLVLRDSLTVLLTRRCEDLKDHPGQISFPGGRAESGDATAVDTALREAHEEVGLAAAQLRVLGCLPTYTTVTGFIVTPVVALVQPKFALRIDPREVAEVFEVPLAFLMAPANHRRHRVLTGDAAARDFLSMPWSTEGTDGAPKCHFIWGATAAILRNLYRFLAA